MTSTTNRLIFEILIDESFNNINTDSRLSPTDNKKVLSIINDFENREWRYKKFQNFIWDNIKETALTEKERKSLIAEGESSVLSSSAQNLRLTDKDNDPGKGSEIAEILLYGIMKRHYKALPVVPKIFYKQNSNDPAKGADSVHIVIDEENNNFTLWFGEAKFYNSIDDARLPEIIKSVEESLQVGKLKKENSIITNLSELDNLSINETITEKIKTLLSANTSIDEIKPILHIPILLLHECLITKDQNSLTEEYKNEIITHHKDRAESYFKKQISKLKTIHKYSDIHFHIILFPVPNKSTIVAHFTRRAESYLEPREEEE